MILGKENKKVCIHCGLLKLIPLFKKEKARKDGTSNQCIECYQIRYRKPREVQAEIINLSGEEWKLVPDLGNMYKISSYGRLLSLNYNRQNISKIIILPILKGYHRVAISVNNIKGNFSVHRLVAMAFIPNPNNLPFINHINGIKTDNRVENLEWCTASYNLKHAFRTGLKSNAGEKHSKSTLTDSIVKEIRIMIASGKTNTEISKSLRVTSKAVSNIRCNRRWTHI